MVSVLQPPLVGRNGRLLQALVVGRISTINQDKRSNDDQVALCKRWVGQHYDGRVQWQIITSQSSGEIIDRQELYDTEALVEHENVDLVIVEDLGRICRRNRAFDFCELCEDHRVRFIAINDHIDTARDDWRLNAFFATFRHQLYNKDTSERIKRTLRNRFQHGGVFQCPIFGYIKPAGSKSDEEVSKDPKAASIYDDWFRMLDDGASYSEVADWLNRKGIEPGPYSRSKSWSGVMVRRVTFNPILKGMRERNRKESKRTNSSGRRRCVNAHPDLLLTRSCPHLAFIDPERYDRVVRKLHKRNEEYARGRRRNDPDCRLGVPRKRTIWPGQHIRCGVCGRLYYWGGHGQADHMMCSGAREYRCWNAVSFDGHDASRRLVQAIMAEVEKLPEFEPAFIEKVNERMQESLSGHRQELKAALEKLDGVHQQIENVSDAIAKTSGQLDPLTTKLASLVVERNDLQDQITALRSEPENPILLPSVSDIKRMAKKSIESLAKDSPEFGRLMHTLVPRLTVHPYRLCDGGDVVLRAKVVLDLVSLTKLDGMETGLSEVLRREIVVDLFDQPQRAKFRFDVLAKRSEGMTEREVAVQLNLTVTAAQRAAALDRLMKARNLSDPYIGVTEPPADGMYLKRHLHRRYQFEPLDNV